ncbi:MAG: carboxymuconolactone decarboxylase family protein [bacterium]|nr:carboxymuconolactone decarboxylase family protein [bacterium]
MTDKPDLVSEAFRTFMSDAPEFAQAWGSAVRDLAEASTLDDKTRDLAYLAVLAALNRTSGIPFHVASLKKIGATRDEVISAILIGLPAVGHVVTQSLPMAIEAYDSTKG